jgi:uncharacterized protein YqgC (DUF456 family)
MFKDITVSKQSAVVMLAAWLLGILLFVIGLLITLYGIARSVVLVFVGMIVFGIGLSILTRKFMRWVYSR